MLDALFFVPTTLLISLVLSIRYLTLYTSSASHRLTSPSSTSQGVWHFEREGYNLTLWSGALNHLPRRILNKLNIALARRLRSAYDLGVGLGLLGLVASLGVGVWATADVWRDVWREMEIHTVLAQAGNGTGLASTAAAAAGAEVVRRAVVETDLATATGAGAAVGSGAVTTNFGGGLQPLVPGLTMPWAHLPTLVLVLAINQLVHEFGHAISAALDDIQPARFSLNLHAGIPSMMVSFPSTVDALDPNAKMRLATSGPFHNLLTWFFVWLLGTADAGSVFWYDRGSEGRVVHEVYWRSPLYAHLHPGDLLVHLDDVPLATSAAYPDPWTEYLLSSRVGDAGRGWCMDKSAFLGLPHVPCHDPSSDQGELTFISTSGLSKGEKRCLSPHPILDIASTACPCPDSRWVCVRPAPADEHVLRVGVRRHGVEEIVLWNGPREEVLETVKVGTQGARGWGAGVRWAELFFGYISTIALSLFFFNLLPLPYTDGSQLLSSLLEWRSVRPSVYPAPVPMKATLSKSADGDVDADGNGHGDLESASAALQVYREYELDEEGDEEAGLTGKGQGKEERWRRHAKVGVSWFTLALAVAWAGGWAMLALLRSS